ncbi:MAG: type II 3-dehydroquinate dehydratase [Prevotella sp.]|nr:type II 3-dehydroquinate dehydratase [Staphylococcus sp.]MCM1350402.1 type II 3-dehydroquinate dehydratase [Prevotella sp.]
MKLWVINGPNLNLLGIREPEIYGHQTYQDLCVLLEEQAKDRQIQIEIFQFNAEGAIVDKIQEAYFQHIDGIIINPAAYTHTSVAILDALQAVMIPTVEVHLSNIQTRESFREHSYVRLIAKKTIQGHGFQGYIEAMDYLIQHQ